MTAASRAALQRMACQTPGRPTRQARPARPLGPLASTLTAAPSSQAACFGCRRCLPAPGITLVQDFSADERSLLRFTVDTGVIFSMVAILFMFERVRVMAVEAQTRDGPQRRHRWAGA
jgi:hypothetical protein